MKRYGLLCFVIVFSGLCSIFGFAAAYTPGSVNGTYSLNFSANQYANDTVMTNNLGGGWKTNDAFGNWRFYTGYDVGGYVYADDINGGSAGNHPWLFSSYGPTSPYNFEFAALLSSGNGNNSLGPQYGLRVAIRMESSHVGYGTNQDGIWFGMGRHCIYLTNSNDGDGHYGTGFATFNLANYDLFRSSGDNNHTGFTRFRIEDKGDTNGIFMSVKLGDGWWQTTHKLYNISSTGYTILNYENGNTYTRTVKNSLRPSTGNMQFWHHSGTQKQTRIADVSVNESYPTPDVYVEKPVPYFTSFSLASSTHTVSASVNIHTTESVFGEIGNADLKYTARPLAITLKPGRKRDAYIANFTTTDNKGNTGQTVAQTIVTQRSSEFGVFVGKAQHAEKQVLTSGTSKIRTEATFLMGVSEGTHSVTTGHRNNGTNEDVSTRYYVIVDETPAETIGTITARNLGTLNVDASGNLSTASFDIASYILTRIKTNGETSLSYKEDIDKVTVVSATNGKLTNANQSLKTNTYQTNQSAAGSYTETITFTLQDQDGVTIATDGKISVSYTVPKILSGITLYLDGNASDTTATVLDEKTCSVKATYKNASEATVTATLSTANANAISLNGTKIKVESIGTKNNAQSGSCVISASYTQGYNNSVSITKTDSITVTIQAKSLSTVVAVAPTGTTNLAQSALTAAKNQCSSTASLGGFSVADTTNGTVTTAGVYTPRKTTAGIYSTSVTAYGYNAAGYTVQSGTVTAQYMVATASDVSFVYDGTAKSITVQVPSGVTVTYGTTQGSLSGTKPSITDVGSLTIYWKMEKSGYTAVTGVAKVTVTPKQLTAVATADSKYYDATTAILEGEVYLQTPVSGDDVRVTYTSFVFENPVVGENKTVYARGLALSGTDKNNYTLKNTEATTSASIYPYVFEDVYHTSHEVNTAQLQDVKNAIQAKIAFTLPQNAVYRFENGDFGVFSGAQYTRVDDFCDALGVTTDVMELEILEDGVVVMYGMVHLTVGQNYVYGDNTVLVDAVHKNSGILMHETAWTVGENHISSIRTNTPTATYFNVYLLAGQSIEVGTEIGMYYGRVDVTVRLGESEQAKDKIDAFFPLRFYDAEKYTVSNMHSSRVQNEINENRGDYWNDIPAFKAPKTGVYNVEIRVTGSSYLLDAIHGLGDRYKGNIPADPPKTTICYVTIK